MSKYLSDLFRKWDACGGARGFVTTTLSQQNEEKAIYHSVNKQISQLKESSRRLELRVIMYGALTCTYLFRNQPISTHCPNTSLIKWDAERHKHIPSHTLSTLPVMAPNRTSSPADNALWQPSPWELLHMLWVVVKETWLNNGPSHAPPDSLVLRCVPAMWK